MFSANTSRCIARPTLTARQSSARTIFSWLNSHVGHNCQIGNHVIIANGALLGRTCRQCKTARSFPATASCTNSARVGTLAMMQGGSAISKDLPPFTIAHGDQRDLRIERRRLAARGFHGGTTAGIEKALSFIVSQRKKFAGGNCRGAKNFHQPGGENPVRFCGERETRRLHGHESRDF